MENEDKAETGVLARVTRLLAMMGFKGGENVGAKVRTRLGKTDFGVLQVALMIAALDGVILPGEYAAFDKLARKCRGYSEEAAQAAFDAALHAAGYLLLQSGRVDERKLLELFADEAEAAMPSGFAYGSPMDVRRAFVMWTAMGMSDGEFSGVERQGIQDLKSRFAELKRERFAADVDGWCSFSMSGPDMPVGTGQGRELAKTLKLIPDDFLVRAEALLARLGESAADEAAEQELVDLIVNG